VVIKQVNQEFSSLWCLLCLLW